MTNPVDSKGEVAIDFAWGNMPIQPDDVRQSSPTQTVTAGGDQNVGWTNYGTIASAKLATNPISVTLNNLTYTVSPDNHVIAAENWNSYPGYDVQTDISTQPGGSGVRTDGTATITVPSVIGKGVQEAEDTLHLAGLDVVLATRTTGATAANHDTVYSQSIAAGASSIHQGDSITITVYKFHDATTNPSGNLNG
jgi:hypothetical protein